MDKTRENDIETWCKEIINGVGGLKDYEKYEMAVPKFDDHITAAIWTIRCLANPLNAGSQMVIDAIIERRREMFSEVSA